jgi:hypothetical protein
MDTDITDKYGASHAEGVLIEDLETRGELVEQKNSDFDGDNINLQDERAVVRKLDIVLLPMMAVALFVGYLVGSHALLKHFISSYNKITR